MERVLQKVNHQGHLAEWSRRVEACRKSGQRVSEWCGGSTPPDAPDDLPFAGPAPLRLSSLPAKKIHPVTIKRNILFKSTLHFIELYCILSHSVFLCKILGDLTLTLFLCFCWKIIWVKKWVSALTQALTHTGKCAERSTQHRRGYHRQSQLHLRLLWCNLILCLLR